MRLTRSTSGATWPDTIRTGSRISTTPFATQTFDRSSRHGAGWGVPYRGPDRLRRRPSRPQAADGLQRHHLLAPFAASALQPGQHLRMSCRIDRSSLGPPALDDHRPVRLGTIDRQLTQLISSGALQGLIGVALGSFEDSGTTQTADGPSSRPFPTASANSAYPYSADCSPATTSRARTECLTRRHSPSDQRQHSTPRQGL